MKALMGIDMGGTMVKAAVFDLEGHELASCGEKLITLQPHPGWMERDLNDAALKVYRCIRGALTQACLTGTDVLAIGVTGQGNGAFLFDESGAPVCPGVMSSDLRAKEYIRRWYQDGTFAKVYPITRQQLWAGNICAIIRWFADHDPQTLARARHIVTAKDYARYLLTGEFHTELTEGSGTSCMDQATRRYSPEVFALLGIPGEIDKLPPPILSDEIGGRVTENAAALTGLTAGIPVVGGQFDVSASVVSARVVDEGQIGVVVGSWSINSIVSRQLVDAPELFMQHVYTIDGFYNLLEGSPTSASNQEWFIDAFLTRDEAIYDRCNQMVSEAPWQDTVLYLPYVYGSNTHMDAKGMFVGLNGTHDKRHMLRAVYEGVAFSHKLHIERLLNYAPMPGCVRIAGGAARSRVWMQLFADVLNADIAVSHATELGAKGVAMNAAVAAGVFPSMAEAAQVWCRIKRVYHPDPAKTAYYERKYQAFRSVIRAMDAVWPEIDALQA